MVRPRNFETTELVLEIGAEPCVMLTAYRKPPICYRSTPSLLNEDAQLRGAACSAAQLITCPGSLDNQILYEGSEERFKL
jgi:hypothetical protein